jgi:hypothetical protein
MKVHFSAQSSNLAGYATRNATEREMFWRPRVFVGGHMTVVVSGIGGIMNRVAPNVAEQLVATSGARYAEMRGRSLPGWVRIDADGVGTTRQVVKWVTLATTFVETLPPKQPRQKR